MSYLPEDFIAKQLERLRHLGPFLFDQEADAPPMAGVQPERDALMLLIQRGLAELDYSGVDVRIRAKVDETPAHEPDLPYTVTPAVLALRARRAAIGR